MPFEKGNRANPSGRPKGSLNKAPAKMRKAIFAALEAGEGAQAYFEWLKVREPAVYGSLLKAYIPKDVNVDVRGEVLVLRDYTRSKPPEEGA